MGFVAACHSEYVAAGANAKALRRLAHNLGINEDLLASMGVPDLEQFVSLYEAGEYRPIHAGAGGPQRNSEIERLIKQHYKTYNLEKVSSRAAVTNLATNCGIRAGFLKSMNIPATDATFVDLYFENAHEITVGPIIGLEQPQPLSPPEEEFKLSQCPSNFLPTSMASSNLLAVDPSGCVSFGELQRYTMERSQGIAMKLSALSGNDRVKSWWDAFSVEGLYPEGKYLGDANGEAEAVASLHRAKAADSPLEQLAAVEDFIRFFCGFHSTKTRCLANAVHFQFEVDQEALISTELPKPSECDMPSDVVRGIFDASQVAAGELLLRAVVEADDGSLIANPFSPGKPMGMLQNLPVYAQYVMVLTNAVEATWYEQAIPNCKLSLNVYASLLVDGAPVLEILDGVSSVEVMEMTKGVERGGVRDWVTQIRETGIEVLLDDFDSRHPGAGSSADGVKICVFANAFHTLQAFNEDGASEGVAVLKKEKLNDMNFRDYHCSLVPTVQPHITKMVFEGSENCMKSTVSPGPPLSFDNARATIASAHVYQTAARIQILQNPGLQMVHQGGRALYDNEEFDDDVLGLLRNLGKDPAGAARKGDAGTVSWMGCEAKRRANMKLRTLVCGVQQRRL